MPKVGHDKLAIAGGFSVLGYALTGNLLFTAALFFTTLIVSIYRLKMDSLFALGVIVSVLTSVQVASSLGSPVAFEAGGISIGTPATTTTLRAVASTTTLATSIPWYQTTSTSVTTTTVADSETTTTSTIVCGEQCCVDSDCEIYNGAQAFCCYDGLCDVCVCDVDSNCIQGYHCSIDKQCIYGT